MKILLNFLLLWVFPIASYAQGVVGKYHSAFYNSDYNVEIDSKEAKYKGKDLSKKEYDKEIYLEVKSDDPNIRAYIQMSYRSAKNLANKLRSKFTSLQNWAKKSKKNNKDEDDGEVTLFFTTYNEELGQEVTCRETGQDYELFFIKEGNNCRMYFDGDSASNEGDFKLKLSGWGLVITSEEDINQIESALNKALEALSN